MEIKAAGLGKSYGEKRVFRDIGFGVKDGQSLAIIGPNGSGKTTLIKILCGLIRPSEGILNYYGNGMELRPDDIFSHIGLVGPYLELYEELTAWENVQFFMRMRNLKNIGDQVNELFKFFKLSGREQDPVKTYSSGMRQRLKYIAALLHNPAILFLDEPTANLDIQGIESVYQVMEEQKRNKILIIATNDHDDLKFGDEQIAVGT